LQRTINGYPSPRYATFSKRLHPPSDRPLSERLRNWKKMETEDEEIAFRAEWS